MRVMDSPTANVAGKTFSAHGAHTAINLSQTAASQHSARSGILNTLSAASVSNLLTVAFLLAKENRSAKSAFMERFPRNARAAVSPSEVSASMHSAKSGIRTTSRASTVTRPLQMARSSSTRASPIARLTTTR